MRPRVVVCSGCCCGNLDKGHNEVPIDFLKAAWEEKGLEETVNLTISGCLGPCSMHNVSLLKTDEGLVWLGELSNEDHYEALVSWAEDFTQFGNEAKLPEILVPHQFVRFEEVIITEHESNSSKDNQIASLGRIPLQESLRFQS